MELVHGINFVSFGAACAQDDVHVTQFWKTIYTTMLDVCLFRFIHTVWHTCENWKEQDPKCSSADGSHLSREYSNDIVLANVRFI